MYHIREIGIPLPHFFSDTFSFKKSDSFRALEKAFRAPAALLRVTERAGSVRGSLLP